MEKCLKIIKVNLLSVIALPLLVLATVSKLTAKALEKLGMIISMLLVTLFLIAGFEFMKHPDNHMNVVANLVVVALFAGIVIVLIVLLLRLAASAVLFVWNGIIQIFNTLYDVTYTGFLHLYASCENDYQYISLNGKKVQNALLCPFYMLLLGLDKLIITVISLALGVSVILSILIVGGTLIAVSHRFQNAFGLNVFEAAARYDTFSRVYGIVLFIAVMALVVTVLLSLGIEWYEWAQELKLTGEQLSADISQLQATDWSLSEREDAADDTYDIYQDSLQQHVDDLAPLGDQVEALLSSTDNSLLRSAWGSYYRNLSDIVDECRKYRSGIPLEQFKRLVPRIKQLDRQREDVYKMIDKLELLEADPVRASVFFSGCNTLEKLDKRYKSLCKAYHPDAEGGDKETFQRMQEEYAALKNTLEGDF